MTREGTRGIYKSKKLSIMISFDIRNACNSAPWDRIIKTLETRGVSGYLIGMVESSRTPCLAPYSGTYSMIEY